MNTALGPVESSVVATRPLRVLPMLGAGLALASLLVATLVGYEGSAIPSAGLAVAAVAVLTAELIRRAWRVARAPEGPLLLLIALAAITAVVAFWSLGLTAGGIAAVLFGAGGTLLFGIGARATWILRNIQSAPWGTLRGVSLHDQSRQLLRTVGPLLLGIILVAMAIQAQVGGEGAATIFLTAAALTLVALWRSPLTPTRTRVALPGRTHTEVAAHLHDSVLQTLALIQRSAHDPARVAQLARQQERSLRDWLAGRDGGTPATVPAALHAIAAEVEQEVPGAAIDVVCVGTAPMDRRSEMLTQAAREAMRNAARHGSLKVRVFCESDQHAVTVYIRDSGPGLRLDDVPADRRGVRDAIIGRMDHVDGTVTIDAGDHGTEIELRLPGRAT